MKVIPDKNSSKGKNKEENFGTDDWVRWTEVSKIRFTMKEETKAKMQINCTTNRKLWEMAHDDDKSRGH